MPAIAKVEPLTPARTLRGPFDYLLPAALAGVTLSVLALAGLVVSYGQGLFGWQEGGFRTEVALAVISETGAVVALCAALALQPAAAPRKD